MSKTRQSADSPERTESEDFERLFHLSLDLLCIAGFDGSFKQLNPAWEKALGYSIEELMSVPYTDFVHPDDRAATMAEAEKVVHGSQTISFENRYRSRDGSYRWLMWSASPAAERQKIYAVARDITSRKQAEQRLAAGYSLTRVLEDSPSLADAAPRILRALCDTLDLEAGVFWRADPGAAVLRCEAMQAAVNATASSFEAETRRAAFGSGEEFPGRVWSEGQPLWIDDLSKVVDSPRDAAAVGAGLRSVFAFPIPVGDAVIGIMEFFSRDLRARDENLLAMLGAAGNQIGQFVDRRRTQREIKEYAASLEEARREQEGNADRLTRLIRELNLARRQAERATRAKSDFLARMSHEIRTPITAITGMTELALATPLTGEQREFLEIVAESSSSLLSLLNDILDFSKIEAGKLELDRAPFSLRDTVEGAVKSLAVRAQQKHLELSCYIHKEVPDALVGDALRLRQILLNLAGNAIKFTDRGEILLRVEMESSEPDGVTLHFAVSDTGPGVPADKQKTIFGSFVQADASTTSRYGGTGLGLTIASQLVSLMNGRIWLKSRVGHGSIFHFTARFEVQSESAKPARPVLPESLRGLPVLVVTSSATNRRIFKEMLSGWSMKPVAAGPAEALRRIDRAERARRPFALLLVDSPMPSMDGLGFVRRVRKHPRHRSAAIILLTSSVNTAEVARARKLGVAACLTKPVKHSDLSNAIVSSLAPAGAPSLAARGRVDQLPAATSLSILVAEDNPMNQKLIVLLLEKRGYRATAVRTGAAALQAIRHQNFNLVLMDVEMPGLNGLEATRLIRQMESSGTRHLPIVAMTAHAMRGDRERCLEAGMDAYVSKPIQASDLFRTIESLVRRGEPLPPRAASESALTGEAAALLERFGGNPQFFRSLVHTFQKDAATLLARIARAIGRQDSEALAVAAHTLKGAAGVFGPGAVPDLARRIEISARANQLEGVGEPNAKLKKELAALNHRLEALSAHFEKPGARRRAPRDKKRGQ
ncbi:MAG: response regulator [Acidobacteriota bacterium]|nr:response regulator [Acidobacteriota bacterium]